MFGSSFCDPLLGSIYPTAEERMRISARWTEDKHFRTAVEFRRDVAEVVASLDGALPWDDLERVIQGWCIVKNRRRQRETIV